MTRSATDRNLEARGVALASAIGTTIECYDWDANVGKSKNAAEMRENALKQSGIATGFGDEWIRFGATSEHTVDGSFSERTMALSKPYPGVQPAYQGNVTTTQNDLNAWVERVHRAGIQINCHANGNVAIDMMLTAVERGAEVISTWRCAAEDHALHANQ
jgi:predicted amidohydrolase YtcJ